MKRIVYIAGILLVLLAAIAVVLPFLIDANQFRPALEDRLTTALGREVKFGDLKVSLFSGGVSASNLSIADDPAFAKTPFLTAESLHIGVKMLPLIFSRKLNVTRILIHQPQIHLVQTPAGEYNFSSIGAKTAAGAPPPPQASPQATRIPSFSIDVLEISDGRIAVEKTGAKTPPLALDKLNITVRDFTADAEFPFSFTTNVSGGGTIKLEGGAGPIAQGSAVNTPFHAKLAISHLDLTGSGLVDRASGIAGVAALDGSVESANATVHVTGKLKAERLVLAAGGAPAKRAAEVDLDLSHNLGKQSGTVRRMAIHLGGAVANLSGTYSLEKTPAVVNLTLAGSKMPVAELAMFLPPLNIALPAGASIDQGTADINLTSEGPLDKLVTRGAIGAENVRLANYDFASKLSVLREFTGIKSQPHTTVQTFKTDVMNTSEGTTLDGLQFAMPSVAAVAGSGTISPSHALNFKMRAALGGGGLASLSGSGGIPFNIQGTAENPSIKPDVKELVTGKFKQVIGKSPADVGGMIKGIFGGKKK